MESLIEKTEELIRLYDESAGLWKIVKKDRGTLESLSIIEDALMKLGLSRNEARVYLYLARIGERKASEISEALALHRTETYRILRDLEKRGLVSSVFEKPLKFIATPFERAMDILIETKKLKIKLLEKEKEKLVDLWLSLPQAKMQPKKREVFQILEGEEQIDLKANEILERTEKEISIFAPEDDLARFYHSGFLDKLEKLSKKKLKIRLLTNKSPKSIFFIEETKFSSVKYSFTENERLSCFIISDKEELLLLIKRNNSSGADEKRKTKKAALWTNYDTFIKVLETLFAELWESSVKTPKIGVKAK